MTAIAVFALAALVALVVASPAPASLKQDLQKFSNCPYNVTNVSECVYSNVTTGEFKIGKSAVPITVPVVIQGGLEGGANHGTLVAATNGETLSKSPQPVPGGLVGIALPGNFSEVTATAELAGQGQIGTTVHLPLKTKLDNPLLGGNCYIGTDAEPMVLDLTYGTTNPPPPNKPISGGSVITTLDKGSILRVVGTLVDNAFAAPGASGCTALPPVGDLAVNNQEGLPAAAGSNTAIQTGTTEETPASLVREILPLPELGRCEIAESSIVGKKTVYHGGYSNVGCTAENTAQEGKYKWTPGPGANSKFSGGVKKITLLTVGGTSVTCTAGSNSGEYTGAKTETVSFTLTGCSTGPKTSPVSCQSSATAGQIQTSTLHGEFEFIKENEPPAKPVIGMDLKPASGPNLATFECGGTSVSVTGSVIAPVGSVDKMLSAFKVKPKASAGLQSPEAFEGGAKDTLTYTASGGGEEQAGLTATSTSTNEEKLELKGL